MKNFIDIIIFAVIAFILFIKLFLILGQKKGIAGEAKPQPHHPFGKGFNAKAPETNEIQIYNLSDPEAKIKILDPSFDKNAFLDTAKEAYKTILEAYASGNTHVLSKLVNIEMMRKFAYQISIREQNHYHHILNIIKSEDIHIEKISLEDNIAEIQVRFISEVINYIGDQKDNCIYGHKSKIEKLDQIWTFIRNLQSPAKTWILIGMTKDFFDTKLDRALLK